MYFINRRNFAFKPKTVHMPTNLLLWNSSNVSRKDVLIHVLLGDIIILELLYSVIFVEIVIAPMPNFLDNSCQIVRNVFWRSKLNFVLYELIISSLLPESTRWNCNRIYYYKISILYKKLYLYLRLFFNITKYINVV